MNHTFLAPLGFKDFLSVGELDQTAALSLFRTAAAVKTDRLAFAGALSGRSIILIFEKPSLRTRVSFESGIAALGGHPIYFDHSSSKLGERESVYDYAKNLERMVDLIVCRTHDHAPLAELGRHARIPVVNALCERFHPCQALADLFTLQEKFTDLRGIRLAYFGDGNNVCHSLMILASTLGVRFTCISPTGYAPEPAIAAEARSRAAASGGSVTITSDPAAAAGADAIYTDTWVSMGDEAEQAKRMRSFSPYQVDSAVMAKASPHAVFMHCLPAKRGEEVAASVIDSPASVVFEQAENRMHVQNALLLHMLCSGREHSSAARRPSVHVTASSDSLTPRARSE